MIFGCFPFELRIPPLSFHTDILPTLPKMTDASAKPKLTLAPEAPGSIQLSKSQMKKRRKAQGKGEDGAPDSPVSVIPDATSAALIEQAPAILDSAKIAPELIAQSEPKADDEPKLSAIVDLVNKRLKAANKKIVRVASTSAIFKAFILF